MSKVYIVSAKRTAIGSFLGSLSTVSPTEFGAALVKNIGNSWRQYSLF